MQQLSKDLEKTLRNAYISDDQSTSGLLFNITIKRIGYLINK